MQEPPAINPPTTHTLDYISLLMRSFESETFAYYKGTHHLGDFPAEAEAATGPFLEGLRSGRDA